MADRIWIPVATVSTGNWSDTAHWSADGITGGASVPTSANDVYFNAASFAVQTGIVTVDATAYCLSMDWTGATNTPTLTIADTMTLNVYSSCTFIAAMVSTVVSEGTYLALRGTGTLTTNGLALGFGMLKVNSTGTVTLADALAFGTGTHNLSLSAGTWVTANQAVTCNGIFYLETSGTKTLTLGSSAITVGGWNYSGSNLTVTANTATINIIGTG